MGLAQVAWTNFSGMEGADVLCMLQQATLTTYSLRGELQTVPLPANITTMHPLPLGLILSVRLRSFGLMSVRMMSQLLLYLEGMHSRIGLQHQKQLFKARTWAQ